MPMRDVLAGPRPPMLIPSNNIDPRIGCRKPLINSINVDLPAPFGPINPVTSPRPTASEHPFTAHSPPYAYPTSRMSSMVSAIGLPGALKGSATSGNRLTFGRSGSRDPHIFVPPQPTFRH